ncbi:NF-kappa-B inhibitor alpha-like [Babylonia areolata]|uniref:NF-kappa-B inhibitor alpha-like n=1 Tax=Babylonia areolata TaxID=304850 RepID=UPI003FD4B3EB
MADLSRNDLVTDEAPPHFRMVGHDRVPPFPCYSGDKHLSTMEERVDSGVGYSFESQDFSALSLEGLRDSDTCRVFRKQNESCNPTSDSFTSGLHNQLRNMSIKDTDQTKESLKSNRCDSGICDSGIFSVEEPFIQAAFPECHLSSAVSYESEFSLQELDELSSQDEDGDTPLHLSIILMLPDVALRIVSLAHSQACINLPNGLHQTPMHLAVATRQFYVVRCLMVGGAALEVPDFCGNTALHLACRDGLLEIALCLLTPVQCPEKLLEACCSLLPSQKVPQDLSLRNYDGYTCAHLALMNGHLDILALLLQKGANVNEPDGKSGRTLLHMAADAGDLSALQLLLGHSQLDLNALTYSGQTAMSLAHGRQFVAFVEQLYRQGADCSQLVEDAAAAAVAASGESTDEEMNDCVYDDICINGEPVQLS